MPYLKCIRTAEVADLIPDIQHVPGYISLSEYANEVHINEEILKGLSLVNELTFP